MLVKRRATQAHRHTIFRSACLSLALTLAPVSAVLQPARADASQPDQIVDDSTPGWTWTQALLLNDPLLYGGTAHAIPPGAEGAYTFQGTGIQVYTLTGSTFTVDGRVHRLGTLDVSLDGVLRKSSPQVKTDLAYGNLSYQASGLPDGVHVLQLRAVDGWAVIDFIKVGKSNGGVDSGTGVPAGYTDVVFQISGCQPNESQRVVVLGNIPELGNWQATHAPVLSYVGSTPAPTWAVKLRIPAAGITLQYKYALWNGSQLTWEPSLHTVSGNHEVQLPAGGEVTFSDGDFNHAR